MFPGKKACEIVNTRTTKRVRVVTGDSPANRALATVAQQGGVRWGKVVPRGKRGGKGF